MTGPIFFLVTIIAFFQQYMQSVCDQHKGQNRRAEPSEMGIHKPWGRMVITEEKH